MIRGSAVWASASAARMTAEARVAASLERYFGLERKAIWPRPARSSEPTWRIRISGSPAMRPPSLDAICASVNGPNMSFCGGGRLAFHRLDHLVGDVDARIRIGGFLEDDVVFLRLGDLADDAVRLLDHLAEFLVAALVHVLAVLALLALELAAEVGEIALLGAALRLRHRQRVLLDLVLQALELVGDLAELRLALGEFRLEPLLRAQRRLRIAHDPLDLDHADLALCQGLAGGQAQGQGQGAGGCHQ